MYDERINELARRIVEREIKCIIFDFDGTLVNSAGVQDSFYKNLLRKYEIEDTEEEIYYIRKLNNFVKLSAYLYKKYNVTAKQEEMQEFWNKDSAEIYRTEVVAFLEKEQYLDKFKPVVTSNGLRRKPELDIFKVALETVCEGGIISKEEVIVIEDNSSGFIPARLLGLEVFAVFETGSESEEEIENIKRQTDGFIGDFLTLLKIMSKLEVLKSEELVLEPNI